MTNFDFLQLKMKLFRVMKNFLFNVVPVLAVGAESRSQIRLINFRIQRLTKKDSVP